MGATSIVAQFIYNGNYFHKIALKSLSAFVTFLSIFSKTTLLPIEPYVIFFTNSTYFVQFTCFNTAVNTFRYCLRLNSPAQ